MADQSNPKGDEHKSPPVTPIPEPDVTPKVTEKHNDDNIKEDFYAKMSELMKINRPQTKEPEVQKHQTDWFKQLNVKSTAVFSDTDEFTIDVQPDFRYPISYLFYHNIKLFEFLDTKNFPFLSVFSFTAYEIMQLTSILLLQDIFNRDIPSYYTYRFRRADNDYTLLKLLVHSRITSETALLFEKLATVKDPNRPNCKYVPTLAGFNMSHDFGRTIPMYIFLIMHNMLYSSRNVESLQQILNQFMTTQVNVVGQQTYRVSNYLGGTYLRDDNLQFHENWFNSLLIETFLPYFGDSLAQRPTYCSITLGSINFTVANLNPYCLMYHLSTSTTQALLKFVSNVSKYCEHTKEFETVPLYAVLNKLSGVTLLSHTVEQFGMPTWHLLNCNISDEQKKQTPETINDEDFINHANLYVDAITYSSKVPYPAFTATEWVPALYSVASSNDDDNKTKNAIKFKSYTRKDCLAPKVLVYQPYLQDSSVATHAITLGLKIINDEIDATCIPVPDPRTDVQFTNSNFLAGSIPIAYIQAITCTIATPIRIIEREQHTEEFTGFALINGAKSILPKYNSTQVNTDVSSFLALEEERFHRTSSTAYTYTAWEQESNPPIPVTSLHLWSSYRYVDHSNSEDNRVVHMFYTLRGHHGVSHQLYLVENPSIRIPRA